MKEKNSTTEMIRRITARKTLHFQMISFNGNV